MSEAPAATRWKGPWAFLLVLLVLALGAVLARSLRAPALDGVERQRAYFGADEPPFGLTLAEAVALPSGERVVRFTAAQATTTPQAALFLEYPSRAPVEAALSETDVGDIGQRLKDWERDPQEAWSTTVKRDRLEWDTWSTKWLVERSFHAGGGWHEEARVDLSTKSRPLVLFVHWADRQPADEKQVLELVRALRLALDA